jgi:hypothetical protein
LPTKPGVLEPSGSSSEEKVHIVKILCTGADFFVFFSTGTFSFSMVHPQKILPQSKSHSRCVRAE